MKKPTFISIKYKAIIFNLARKVSYLKVQHILIIPRNQLFFSNLEENISPENPVRFIDPFADHLSLVDMGFIVKTLKSEGRPSF